MKYAFHPAALEEYAGAAAAYEAHQPGLGERFIRGVVDAIESVCEAPLRWMILEQDVRRRLVRVFPYAILYSVEERYVLIVAVMHCHRKPGYWCTRVTPKAAEQGP